MLLLRSLLERLLCRWCLLVFMHHRLQCGGAEARAKAASRKDGWLVEGASSERAVSLFGYPSANERVYDRCLLYTMQRVRLHR